MNCRALYSADQSEPSAAVSENSPTARRPEDGGGDGGRRDGLGGREEVPGVNCCSFDTGMGS
ncbi:hypothetical protein EYF80_043839 [Liparis tanakae]|uniref:Uncharacterized protein n=1 Tax=Liparis tanakae TaxID=230148 RepID=A0A4Z2FXD6_9TELE|nr:hypothetical protein EYF80_043839 [Liparis tanakae]